FLKDVCRSIDEVYGPHGCFLEIEMDHETINKLRLELTIYDVQKGILANRKLKLKEPHVTVLNNARLRVTPPEEVDEQLYFQLQNLKRNLPDVVLKGLSKITRAVINKVDNDPKKPGVYYEVWAEGYGLQEVMQMDGVDPRRTKTNHIMEMAEVLG